MVDYCLIPHECLTSFKDFAVTTCSELINESTLVNEVCFETSLPDHSLLSWDWQLDDSMFSYKQNKQCSTEKVKYTVFDRNIPKDFLLDYKDEVESTIESLEGRIVSQDTIDRGYSDLVATIKSEMARKLCHKDIILSIGQNNKKRKPKKTWWSDEQTELWNDLCEAEKHMIRCKSNHKNS